MEAKVKEFVKFESNFGSGMVWLYGFGSMALAMAPALAVARFDCGVALAMARL